VKRNRFEALKKVSGKLRQMWLARAESPPREEPLPRLLVVDDEEAICFSMSEYFSLHGYKVDSARETEEAEKLLGTSEYKVVIQDLRLSLTSRTDGLEMIRTIRQHNPQARIIILTAYGSAEVEDEARRCGADAFLRKPKPLSQVAQVVQGLIESPPRHAARPA
jgi:DNA-binding NtrC family response regulator